MSILGVQTILYGVDDLEASARFYDDFGLQPLGRDARGADFGLPEGSRVLLRRSDDPALSPAFAPGPGAREVIWGADSAVSLEALAKSLSADREVTRDADGTLHTHDDIGIPIGFRVWQRVPPGDDETAENGLGAIRRWNAAPQVVRAGRAQADPPRRLRDTGRRRRRGVLHAAARITGSPTSRAGSASSCAATAGTTITTFSC